MVLYIKRSYYHVKDKGDCMMKVAVVGSINMDMTVTAERIPLKGETITGSDIHYIPGGKGANQAVAMARLGAEVTMFGCVGDDDNGNKLIHNLSQNGIQTDYIKVIPEVPTGIAMITVGDNDNTIVIIAGANGKVDIPYVEEMKAKLLESDIVVLQHEIPMETVEYVVALCYENQVKVVLNPGPARPVSQDLIKKVTYLTPNEHEAAIIFGEFDDTDKLLKEYPEKLLITQGSKGVTTCLKSGDILLVPARKAKVVDTTGAGDTLNGAFTVQIADGKSMEEALVFANTAASLSTEKFGAQGGMPYKEDVLKEMNQ